VNFRIRSNEEHDHETGEPLYWSNEDRWVDESSASTFSEDEYRAPFDLPAGDCQWVIVA